MKTPRLSPIWNKGRCHKGVSVAVLALAVSITGCGTISGLKSVDGTALDLTPYKKVVVRDFTDKTIAPEKPEKREENKLLMKRATRDFADIIAIELKKTGAFAEVNREGNPDAETVVVEGAISKFERGNTTARLFVGLGAGSSYLDAVVEVRNAATGALLGSVVVNKNSWGGGGALAAGQTAEGFMEEAAKRISEEISKAKNKEKQI